MNTYQDFHRLPDYKNPEVTGISRLPAHTRFGAFASEEEALRGSIYDSSNLMLLDGAWRFRLYDKPEDAGEFYRKDFEECGYGDIAVPGNWQTQGYGKAVYTNVEYPWENEEEDCYIRPGKEGEWAPDPPHIPSLNPTGCYRKIFSLPAHFEKKRLILRFEGVETAYYVWLNGKEAGFSKDSKLPCEFDVTDLARAGENLLCVQVMHFADSSYLEDQDYWYLSGIFRHVMLIAKPHMAIEDYKITALPDLNRLSGDVSCDISVSRKPGYALCSVGMKIYDQSGSLLAESWAPVRARAEYRTDYAPTMNAGRVQIHLDHIALWRTETPALYRAVILLRDENGRILDTEGCNFGFKKVEIQNGIVLLNGRRLTVFGVNRHEHCWEGGRSVSRAHMLEEIRQMKRMNINSVRTCHYPDSPDWYDLCDEQGILLVCECNLETHGVNGALTHDPAWAHHFLDRAVRMVCNYKNHAAIYSWSLGNESGTGANHAAMAGFIREYDPTRLCQYEAGDPGKNISDVRGHMYATVENIVDMLSDPRDDRPVILVEYLYQIRNSGGGLHKFNDLLRRFPRFQGGYIWDWQDKALVKYNEKGEKYFAYGGEFGVRVNRHTSPDFMTHNGIVQADLTWKPAAYEVQQAYCPVRISLIPRNNAWQSLPPMDQMLVINYDHAHSTDFYRFEMQVLEDGVILFREEFDMPSIPPLGKREIPLRPKYEKKPGCRYDANILVRRKEDTPLVKADEVIGLVQLPLPGLAASPSASFPDKKENPIAVFDPETGKLTALKKNGVNYLAGPLSVCLDRPFTGLDADPYWGWEQNFAPLRDMKEQLLSFNIQKTDKETLAEAKYAYTSQYTIFADLAWRIGNGKVQLDVHFECDPALRCLLRLGVEAVIAPGFEKLTYLGHGPNESYSDRLMSAPFGRYESTVSHQHFPFCPPSENGGHEGTVYIEMENEEGRKLIIRPRQGVHFDVHHNTIEDYKTARFDHELPERAESYLHIDAVHAPIGGDMAWSTAVDYRDMPGGGGYHLRLEIEME